MGIVLTTGGFIWDTYAAGQSLYARLLNKYVYIFADIIVKQKLNKFYK